MKKPNKFLDWLINPRGWWLVIVYIVTLAAIVGALVILTIEYERTWLEIIAYALFALAAIALGYSVYATVRQSGKIKNAVVSWIEKHEFTARLMRDFGFRSVIFTIGSLAFSLLFGVFNGVLGILDLSVWYGSLAVYYIILVCLRSGIILYHGKKRRGIFVDGREREAKIYRTSGILLIFLGVMLVVPVLQMVSINKSFSYAGLMIYATAAYAFTKITMSIINLIRAGKQEDFTVKAIRNINLVDAAVSILALQTALLQTYGGKNTAFIPYMNAATGGVVCAITVTIGVIMIVNANKNIKKIRLGEKDDNGKQE